MGKRNIIVSFIFCVLFMLALPVTAYADMGPKDSLTVYVENPPSEQYYLDLLTQNSRTYDNFHSAGEREVLNSEMLELLYSYRNEGWMPALTEGTGVPMWGDLIGEPDGGRMVHKFGYVGLPDTYRIIIVTESGGVSVSDIFTRAALQSSITYDYATGTAVTPPVFLTYLTQFIVTLTLTLLLEGIVLLLFKIKLKENWKVFLLVNFVTQIVLTLTVGITLIQKGTIYAHLLQFPVEVIIIAGEALIYRYFLTSNSKKLSSVYGIAANLVSWIAGFFLLNHLFIFLKGML